MKDDPVDDRVCLVCVKINTDNFLLSCVNNKTLINAIHILTDYS